MCIAFRWRCQCEISCNRRLQSALAESVAHVELVTCEWHSAGCLSWLRVAAATAAAFFAAAAACWFGGIDKWVKFDSLQAVAFGDVSDERASVGVGVAQKVEHRGLAVEQNFAIDDGQVDVGLGQHGAAIFDQLSRQFS